MALRKIYSFFVDKEEEMTFSDLVRKDEEEASPLYDADPPSSISENTEEMRLRSGEDDDDDEEEEDSYEEGEEVVEVDQTCEGVLHGTRADGRRVVFTKLGSPFGLFLQLLRERGAESTYRVMQPVEDRPRLGESEEDDDDDDDDAEEGEEGVSIDRSPLSMEEGIAVIDVHPAVGSARRRRGDGIRHTTAEDSSPASRETWVEATSYSLYLAFRACSLVIGVDASLAQRLRSLRERHRVDDPLGKAYATLVEHLDARFLSMRRAADLTDEYVTDSYEFLRYALAEATLVPKAEKRRKDLVARADELREARKSLLAESARLQSDRVVGADDAFTTLPL